MHNTSVTKLDLQTTNETLEKSYYFNDIVAYSCEPGYKFEGNHNLVSEFTLQCIENGTWFGFVPDCVLLKCPWLGGVRNGKMLFKTRENDTIELFNIKAASNGSNTVITAAESDFNGNQRMEDQFVVGSEIIIKCDTGYKLIGDGVRICTDSEEWSSTLSSCEPQECPISSHPFFQVLKNESHSNDYANTWENVQFNGSYRNLEYFIEGYNYMKKIVLSCKNNGEIVLNTEQVHGTLSNLTWVCNKRGEWEMHELQLNKTIAESMFNNGIDNICQELMCAPIAVSN